MRRFYPEDFVDPTGTYALASDTTHQDGEVYGLYGDIRVALIDSGHIGISFGLSNGAPAYNSGSFEDTLDYNGHYAEYRYDSNCVVRFGFSRGGVWASQHSDDNDFRCGFGHGVVADGYFDKVSSECPEIKPWWHYEESQ
jgi:hypothetical protein